MIFSKALVTIVLGYLIGSIPFGYLTVKLIKGKDLREVGSGSTGATNVSRVLGKWGFALVSLLDIGKGVSAVLIASAIADCPVISWVPIAAGMASAIGHTYPIWLRFKGGKGVNTTLGAAVVVFPIGAAVSVAVFLVVALTTHFVSVGSLSSGIAFLMALAIANIIGYKTPLPLWVMGFFVPTMIIFTHRDNIGRLKAGRENPFGRENK